MPFGVAYRKKRKKLTYSGYLKISELLQLQSLLSKPEAHDEMLFIIIHQVYELWFKQLLHELDAISRCLNHGETLDAHRLLRRCIEIERVLIAQISVLETMTPVDFLDFRDNLMPASGFQSAQFREIEFLGGLKNSGYLKNFEKNSKGWKQLKKRLNALSLWESFLNLLIRKGFSITKNRELQAQELKKIYEQADQHYDLFLLTESLIEFDELFSRWRLIHVQMVERMIGSKTGTGGTEGVGYLKSTLEKKFFPQLWELRTHIKKNDSATLKRRIKQK